MKDHKQILTDSIKAHEAAIAKAKSEIAELDKPKLRHGDYGLDLMGRRCMTINIQGEGLRQVSPTVAWSCANDRDFRPETILGNIFDDISSKSEKLEKFTVTGGFTSGGIKAKFSRSCIDITLGRGQKHVFTLREAQEIADNLQKVINYAREQEE